MSQKIKWEKETFREFCNHVKDANISFGDFKHTDSTEYPHKDSIPDFVKEDKSIAVELTEYHRDEHSNNEKGENLRKLESIGKSILKNASDHFRYLSPSRRLNVFLNPKFYVLIFLIRCNIGYFKSNKKMLFLFYIFILIFFD